LFGFGGFGALSSLVCLTLELEPASWAVSLFDAEEKVAEGLL